MKYSFPEFWEIIYLGKNILSHPCRILLFVMKSLLSSLRFSEILVGSSRKDWERIFFPRYILSQKYGKEYVAVNMHDIFLSRVVGKNISGEEYSFPICPGIPQGCRKYPARILQGSTRMPQILADGLAGILGILVGILAGSLRKYSFLKRGLF